MLDEYFQVEGREGVGEDSLVWAGEYGAAATDGDLSTTYRSILFCLRANSSPPFPASCGT